MNFARRAIVWGFLAGMQGVTSGCQTLADRKAIAVPEPYRAYFAACAPSDGAVAVQFFRKGELQGSAELEWVAKSPALWQTQLTDPVGRSLLEFRRQGGAFKASGKLAEKLPKLAVRKSGFIEADGHLVALTAGELPCVLAGLLPQGWLALARERELNDAGGARFVLADPVRTITVDFARKPDHPDASVCAQIHWDKYFGLASHEITWCQRGARRRDMRLDSDVGFGLRMVKIDEGSSS